MKERAKEVEEEQTQQQEQRRESEIQREPAAAQNEQLTEIILKYEIRPFYSAKLRALENFRIVFIFDDSGSMNFKLKESPHNSKDKKVTRWEELKYFSEIGIEMANAFNREGTDVYFLNRPVARNLRSPDELTPHLAPRPNGFTPITRAVKAAISDHNLALLGSRKKLLLVIVTDGEPSDEQGSIAIADFRACLESRPEHVYTTIVSCTDEKFTMAYLNNWDSDLPRLDVVDDFASEREQILAVQGQNFVFSYGDYIVKCLLGSVDSELDNLDEINIQ